VVFRSTFFHDCRRQHIQRRVVVDEKNKHLGKKVKSLFDKWRRRAHDSDKDRELQ